MIKNRTLRVKSNVDNLNQLPLRIYELPLKIKTENDFVDMISKSPYSNKSEFERRKDLEVSVEEAKAALSTFSYQQKSLISRFREFFVVIR